MLFKCQAVVKCNTKIHWIVIMLELLSIPNDAKLYVGKPNIQMKGANLGFRWIGSQVIDFIVLFQLVECIAKSLLYVVKPSILASDS